jgi:hypothetical protein
LLHHEKFQTGTVPDEKLIGRRIDKGHPAFAGWPADLGT